MPLVEELSGREIGGGRGRMEERARGGSPPQIEKEGLNLPSFGQDGGWNYGAD